MNANSLWHKNLLHACIWVLVFLLAAPVGAQAQNNGPADQSDIAGVQTAIQNNEAQTLNRAQLDQMLAPIALYPDSLLAQVLIAATYPDQVAAADQWVKGHLDLKGDALNSALNNMNWDLSVKALAPFPQVLGMMDEHMDWTKKIGHAFLAQQADVMSSIQSLRHKAYAQGNLKTTEQQKVAVQGEDIEIEPAQPDTVYVPYYDPSLVYGSWGWPDYPPFAYYALWGPWFTAGLFGWGWGVGVGPNWGWGWGSWNWGGGNAYVNVNRNININDRHQHLSRNNLRTADLARASRAAARTGVDPVRNAGRLAGARTGVARGAAGRTGVTANRGAYGRSRTSGTPSVRSAQGALHGGGARGGTVGRTGVTGRQGLASSDRDIGTRGFHGQAGHGRVSHGSFGATRSFGGARSFGGFHDGGGGFHGGGGGFHGGGGGFHGGGGHGGGGHGGGGHGGGGHGGGGRR